MQETPAEVLLPEWFTPEDDDGNPIVASFKLRPLNGMEYLEVMSLGVVSGKNFNTSHEGKEFLVRRGLVDWKTMEASNGDPIPFSIDNAYTELSAGVLLEIANKVFLKASLAEEARKNSRSQSKSLATPSDSTAQSVNGGDTVIPEIPPP